MREYVLQSGAPMQVVKLNLNQGGHETNLRGHFVTCETSFHD